MNDAILHYVLPVMESSWIYLALFALSMIDAFFPAVPSESVVITAGVFAASTGSPNLALIIVLSALGAFLGDHISYAIGRTAGYSLLSRMREGTKRRAAYEWAGKAIEERGGLILVVARYIPGGRVAVTMTCGAVRYPLRKFMFFDAIAAASWGVYSALIGYVGGAAFEENPIMGLLVGFGLALAITAVVEIVRYFRKRSNNDDSHDEDTGGGPAGGSSTNEVTGNESPGTDDDNGSDDSSSMRMRTRGGLETPRG